MRQAYEGFRRFVNHLNFAVVGDSELLNKRSGEPRYANLYSHGFKIISKGFPIIGAVTPLAPDRDSGKST